MEELTLPAQELSNERLKKAVKEYGSGIIADKELAKKAGINVSYYAFIERGEVDASISKLEKISKALSVNSSELLNF